MENKLISKLEAEIKSLISEKSFICKGHEFCEIESGSLQISLAPKYDNSESGDVKFCGSVRLGVSYGKDTVISNYKFSGFATIGNYSVTNVNSPFVVEKGI